MKNIKDIIFNELVCNEDSSDTSDDIDDELMTDEDVYDSDESDDTEDEEDDKDNILVLKAIQLAQKHINLTEILASAAGNVSIQNLLDLGAQCDVVSNLHFYEEIPRFNDSQFHSHFQMSRETYLKLENIIRPRIVQEEVEVPLRKRILLTLWTISTPENFQFVADRFGLMKSSAHYVFKQVIWILRNLMPEYIKWPKADECAESEREFRLQSRGFPGVVGAIGSCHIEIKQPPRNSNDYFNRKEFYSIILQGVCDHTGKFIDCLIGRPGRARNAAVFKSSVIYEKLIEKEHPLLPPDKHIIGDSSYPLLKNVMTPFRDNGNPSEPQRRYNTALSSMHSIIEKTFALLKGKWKRLEYLDVNSVEMGNNIIAAACTLHNFLFLHNESGMDHNHYPIDNFNDDNDEYDNNDHENADGPAKKIEIMNRL